MGNSRRPQHCLGSDMPGRLQDTPLACPVGTVDVQGSVLGAAVDLSALPYFLCPFPGSYRAGVPGRLFPVGFDCASWRRAVSKGSAHPRSEMWSESEVVFGQAFRSKRPSGGGLESEASVVLLSVGEAGRSQKRAPFLLGQAFRLVIWITLPACCLGFVRRPKSCTSFAMSPARPSLCWEAGP